MSAQKIALATVVTDDFLPGACVAISSFLRHNAWFEGDVVVIHRDLTEPSRAALGSLHPNVSFHPLGIGLVERMDAVSKAAGWKDSKAMQFAAIEAVSLSAYDQVVFCDSDLLFLGSIEECLTLEEPLIACGDGAHFRGNLRRLADFAEMSADQADESDAFVDQTFNTGMMILRRELLTPASYQSLVELVDPARWAEDQTGHTDQMVFNIHFAGQQALAPIRFNYLLTHRKLIADAAQCPISDAVTVHFTGAAKPWLPIDQLTALGIDADYFEAYRKWREAAALIDPGTHH